MYKSNGITAMRPYAPDQAAPALASRWARQTTCPPTSPPAPPRQPYQLRRPGTIETYLFSMFNENLKESGVEQNWSFCYPNMEHVYPISFN
jgi:hypothetical protein